MFKRQKDSNTKKVISKGFHEGESRAGKIDESTIFEKGYRPVAMPVFIKQCVKNFLHGYNKSGIQGKKMYPGCQLNVQRGRY